MHQIKYFFVLTFERALFIKQHTLTKSQSNVTFLVFATFLNFKTQMPPSNLCPLSMYSVTLDMRHYQPFGVGFTALDMTGFCGGAD